MYNPQATYKRYLATNSVIPYFYAEHNVCDDVEIQLS